MVKILLLLTLDDCLTRHNPRGEQCQKPFRGHYDDEGYGNKTQSVGRNTFNGSIQPLQTAIQSDWLGFLGSLIRILLHLCSQPSTLLKTL